MRSERAPERPLLSVVVPAYNEALLLMGSLTTLYEYLRGLGGQYRFELLVVNDGSKDETGAIADSFATSRPEVRVLHNPVNFRLGEALRRGIASSVGDYVVTFDSDLSYEPEHIERMVTALRREHARIVVASPYAKDGLTTAIPFRRELMSRAANKLLAVSSEHDVTTVTGMVRAYDGPFVRSLNLKAMGPEINSEILYKAQILRARVVEIPAHLDWSNQAERLASRKVSLRVSATSKLFLFASFLFRPLYFFVVPGLVLMLISMWTIGSVAMTVFEQYTDASGNVDHRVTDAFAAAWALRPQSFVIGGLAFVVAVQLISLGVLATQAKRYFEELFHLQTRSLRGINALRTGEDPVASPSPRPAAERRVRLQAVNR
jgi:glycosyltransferase involved in cell wall biosynthesis